MAWPGGEEQEGIGWVVGGMGYFEINIYLVRKGG